MNLEAEKVREYFYRTAETFDGIYSGKKGRVFRLLDRYLRPDMYQRFYLAMEHGGPVEGKAVLDLGCGSGRYSVEFAKRGAERVVGVDFAESMIRLADAIALDQDVNNICEFNVGDLFEYQPQERFDLVLSIGVFDYTENPLSLLEKMQSLSRGKLIATFPSYSAIRTPIRKVRYKLKRCPVYFYTHDRIQALFDQAGLSQFEVIKIKGTGMDFFVHADVPARD